MAIDADARQRLTEVTGLSGDRLESWATEAGFDIADPQDVSRLEKLMSASTRGQSAKHLLATLDYGRSTEWLSREDAEREVVERARQVLHEALGTQVDVSFADCRIQSSNAKVARDGQLEDAILTQGVDASFKTIQLCR